MRLLSFRFKIALLSAVISGLVLLGFGAASWYLLYRQKLASVDTELRALGTRHPGWLANRANFDRFNTSLQFIFGEEQEGRVILMVKDAQAQTLYVSPGWPKAIAADSIDCSLEDDKTAREQAAAGAETSDQHGPPWRGMGKGRGGGGRGPGYGLRRGASGVQQGSQVSDSADL